MLCRATVLILIGVLFPGIALADIYYWADDQGTQYFTTTPESIPETYRSKAVLLPIPTSPPVPPELERTRAPQSFTKVPFTPGLPVLVSAKINGAGPISLILDTGSDRTLVAPAVLQRLGVSTEDASQGVVKGVTGTSSAVTVWVQSVEVGEARVGPLLIVVHDADLKGADGLLGRDFLANFNVTIDSKEKVVTLAPN